MNSKIRSLILACALMLGVAAAPARADQQPVISTAGPEYSSALQVFYQQDWPKAIDAFNVIVDKDRSDSLAWFFLFDSYIKRNDLRSVLYQLEQKSMSTDNKNAQALAELGIGYVARYMKEPQSGMLDEAQKTLEKAIEIDKNNSVAHTGLGLVYYLRRMMARAKGNFLEAYRANPNDLMALERLAEITMVDEKRPQEANEMFQELVKKAPQYPDGYWYVGSSFYDMGEYAKCIDYMDKVIELDPKGVTQGYRAPMLAGKACMKLKDYKRGADYFLTEMRINPSSEEARYLYEQCKNPNAGQPQPSNNGNGKNNGKNSGKNTKKGNNN